MRVRNLLNWTLPLLLALTVGLAAGAEDDDAADENASEQTQDGAPGAGEQISNGFKQGWRETKEGTVKAADQVGDGFKQGWEKTKDGTKQGWEKTKDGTTKAADKTGEGFKEGWDDTKKAVD
jgi:hypothetical protein